jgi:hypothetical protein
MFRFSKIKKIKLFFADIKKLSFNSQYKTQKCIDEINGEK